MNLSGLLSGAGVVAGGYRAAETQLRAAEEERLKLEQLRLEQAERRREEEFRRTMPKVEVSPPAAMPGALPPPVGAQQLPPRPGLRPVVPVLPSPAAAGATAAPVSDAWAERGPGGGAAPAPEMYVGPAPAPVTSLRPAGAPVDEVALRRQQDAFRMYAMRVRDAVEGLNTLRSQNASPERIARQEALVRRQQEQLDAARQGLERITGASVPAAPAAPAAPTTQPDVIQRGVRIPPEVQAQRDAEAAQIRAQELGTVARADSELVQVEQALRQRGMAPEQRGILERERSQITAARAILAGQAPAAAAPAAAAAGAPAAPPPGPAATVLAQPTPGVRPAPAEEPIRYYMENPGAITTDQQYLDADYTTQRQIVVDDVTARQATLDASYRAARSQLVSEYNARANAGQARQASEVLQRINLLDEKYRTQQVQNQTEARTSLFDLDTKYRAGRLTLAGAAAAAQLEYLNRADGAAQMLSFVNGFPMRFDLRSDGTYAMMLQPEGGGELVSAGNFTKDQVRDMVRSATDAAYRAAKAELAGKTALERLKGELKVTEQQAQMIRELAKASLEGQSRMREIQLQGQQLKVQADGNGGVILYTPNGQTVGRVQERKVTVDGQPSTSFVLAPIQIR